MGVRERLDVLHKMSPEELRALPASAEQPDETVGHRTIRFVLWHDQPASGLHRFVIGRYDMSIAAGWHNVEVDGFALDERGQVRQLTDDELRDFT